MAKAPLANDTDAPRPDRPTRIASGPAPMPLPAPPSIGKPPVPPQLAAQASLTAGIKKTQVIVGAPPVPAPISGKTGIPTGPGKTSIPTGPGKTAIPTTPGKTAIPTTPVPDGSLPSYQETVIGPAPAPPVPVPPPARAAAPDPGNDDTVVGPAPAPPDTIVGPAPAPPVAKPARVAFDSNDAEMDALIASGLFGDLDAEALEAMRGAGDTLPAPSRVRREVSAPVLAPAPTSVSAPIPVRDSVSGPIHVPPRSSGPIPVRDSASGPIHDPSRSSGPISVRDTISGPLPVPTRDSVSGPIHVSSRPSGPIPVPPRPSGPAPSAKATGTRDTLPNADLRSPGATFPPTRQSLGIADTHLDLDPEPAAAARESRRPTTGVMPSRPRESRVGTQNQGADGLVVPSTDAPKLRLVPGKVIPGTRYEIRRWLGEGGMGVVYEVVHTDIDRRSALKILRFDLSQQPQMAQVFRDEARAASRLGSPNIVEVYDFGELPDGRLFFAMELLEGEDLVPADEQTSMDPGRLVGILRQVCKGLHRAHEAGVVHRDVKPENILITKVEGRADHVKIVDFGISAMLAAGEQRIGIAGTPHYMAPEQILGETFDGRLDVYALGCTAYELLAGKPPFDDEEVEGILKKQCNDTPASIQQLRPDLQIPAELEAVILRCLAKKAADRYADMADLEAALCEAQIAAGIVTPWDDLPIPPLPDDERRQRIIARMPSRDLMLPPRRGLFWPIVALTSTLAAGGLTAFLMFGLQPTEAEKDVVEQLTIQARDAASKASWVVPPPHLDTTVTALTTVVALEAVEGNAEELADERAAELRHEFATTLVLHGNELWDGAARDFALQYYAWSLAFEHDDEVFDRANIDVVTLQAFRRRAEAGQFSEADRVIAGVLAFEAEEDPNRKQALAVALNEGLASNNLSPMARATLTEQVASAGVKVRGSGVLPNGSNRSRDDGGDDGDDDGGGGDDGGDVAGDGTPEGVEAADDAVLIDDEALEGDDAVADEGRKKRRQKVDLGLSSKKASFDPARSKDLTAQGDTKRKQGLRNEAKSLYGQAIAANPNNGEAHLGMALVHFDQGSYHQARKAAEQAVKHAPRNGRAHKALGDALFKEFHYQKAEESYLEAQRLGVSVGTRLTEVRKKQGK
jgi:serine/threonine protein kinase/tetratricopeptide (TPR) repeat protein